MRSEEEIRKMLELSKQVDELARQHKGIAKTSTMAVVHTLEWVLE